MTILAIVLGVAFGVSEILAAIPAVKSNSVGQVIINLLRTISGRS